MVVKLWFITIIFISINSSLSSKQKFTLDEFFNYTDFPSLTVAPNDGQSILIQTLHRIWDQNTYENHLYLQTLRGESKKLITTQASGFKPQWKDQWIALKLADNSASGSKQQNTFQYIHLYSTLTEEMIPLAMGKEEIHAFTWSSTSMSLYFATRKPWSNETEVMYKDEWKDVIEYREQYRGDTIYRADIVNMTVSNIELLTNISLRVSDMLCSPDGNQLIYSTDRPSLYQEQISDYELYSLNLTSHPPLIPLKLTNNKAMESNLKWSTDGLLFFTVTGAGSIEGDYKDSQGRLYSLNTTSHRIERWATQFKGNVYDYALLQGGQGGVIILGQLSTEIQIYMQKSVNTDLIKQIGWNGSYERIKTALSGNSSTIVFTHSSYETPQEVYFIDSIDQLNIAQAMTSENKLFTNRSLPQGKSYRWLNEDDKIEIEGVLLYPPDQFEQKNLPLYVLIHGGPYGADSNGFRADWYSCASMIATEGWLVLQPNYRGSTGYGDEFLQGVQFQLLSRPGKDILYGVDALIRDGIVDPKRLTIGGYSYGAYLTNWLITQTTRFNAALSGAGAVEHVADWGTTDIPMVSIYTFGGFPWQVPNLYQSEAAILQLHKVHTPTLIIVPGNDIRVPSSGNYILERGLHALNVPTKLIVLPDEPHLLGINPWHEKIKVREEIKWLQKYGNSCILACDDYLRSNTCNKQMHMYTFIFPILALTRLF